MMIFTIIMLQSSRTGMPAILREALLARSTIDISTSTSFSSSTSSENLVSENLGHFENAEDFENVKDFENVDQMVRTSLSDLSLEEAAEVKFATMTMNILFSMSVIHWT